MFGVNVSGITSLRLHNQGLAETRLACPEEVVSRFGAMQAQDYAAAKWAVALRAREVTNSSLDRAFTEGKILRTHVLRPTWQFVSPTDIRWMLKLSGPRVRELNTNWHRKIGLEDEVFIKAEMTLSKVLKGKHMTRSEIASELKQTNIGVNLNNLRLAFIMMQAELDGVVCSGALKGKQHTYALLDERVPSDREFTRDEALAELTKRYFTSHSPATVKDYSWWSSFSVVEVKRGVEMLSDMLVGEKIGGQDYWFFAPEKIKYTSKAVLRLLPNFDEYIIGYANRSAIFDASYAKGLDARYNPLFQPTIVLDGQVIGTWKRTIQKRKIIVTAKLFLKLANLEQDLLAKAVEGYSKFMELPFELNIEENSL
jgi:hypothetical protein